MSVTVFTQVMEAACRAERSMLELDSFVAMEFLGIEFPGSERPKYSVVLNKAQNALNILKHHPTV